METTPHTITIMDTVGFSVSLWPPVVTNLFSLLNVLYSEGMEDRHTLHEL